MRLLALRQAKRRLEARFRRLILPENQHRVALAERAHLARSALQQRSKRPDFSSRAASYFFSYGLLQRCWGEGKRAVQRETKHNQKAPEDLLQSSVSLLVFSECFAREAVITKL